MDTRGFSETLARAVVAKALRDLRRSPPHLTNALFIASGVSTFDELAALQAENTLEIIAVLAGKNGRPTVAMLEACAADGSDEGLDLLVHRLFCNKHKPSGTAS